MVCPSLGLAALAVTTAQERKRFSTLPFCLAFQEHSQASGLRFLQSLLAFQEGELLLQLAVLLSDEIVPQHLSPISCAAGSRRRRKIPTSEGHLPTG